MSRKMLSALLIVSLSFNLAVLGMFLYKNITGAPPQGPPFFNPRRPPFLEQLDIAPEQRRELEKRVREFHRENIGLKKEIARLERQLLLEMEKENSDSARVDSLVNELSGLKKEFSLKAARKLKQAGKILTPRQRKLFLNRLLMPGKGPGPQRIRRPEKF
ncbi:MAG: periplasmic heavy metal sensor [Calditrichaeota bacterium]|nr:MAG: periplasmic heavy metal sensor [Calditrichota bacterium]